MSQFDYHSKAGSIFKLIKSFGVLTKEPISITIEGVTQTYSPPQKIVISEKFFRGGKCEMCGKCCKIKCSLVFTTSDDDRILQTGSCFGGPLEALTPIEVKITTAARSSRSQFVYVYENKYKNENEACDFIDKNRCTIHHVKPVHCALPLLEIDQYSKGNKVRVIKRQRGRNWRFGCPIKFGPFNYEEFVTWDLYNLNRLRRNADDLSFKTWLPEIVNYLDRNKESFRERVPVKPIVIYENGFQLTMF